MTRIAIVLTLLAIVMGSGGAGASPELTRDGSLVINGETTCDYNPQTNLPPCIIIILDPPFNIDSTVP